MILADEMATPSQIGIWVICTAFVVQLLYHLKGLLTKPKTISETTHRDYKQQFVTRGELNGKLDKLEQSMVRLVEKIDGVSKEVAGLRALVKPYWQKD